MRKLSAEQFVQKAEETHGDKYSYSKARYVNMKAPVCIICPKHGEFWQRPDHHLRKGYGCPECSYIGRGLKKRQTFEQFCKKARKIHGRRYEYPQQSLTGVDSKIRIICPEHGEFWQSPHDHLQGHGCRFCSASRGEQKIADWLNSSGFIEEKSYFREKKFPDLGKLRYDFYLQEENLLIEYNGEQHYLAGRFGDNKLRQQRHRDWLKRKYARDHGIRLLTIPYTQFNMIEEILKENILCQPHTHENGLHSD